MYRGRGVNARRRSQRKRSRPRTRGPPARGADPAGAGRPRHFVRVIRVLHASSHGIVERTGPESTSVARPLRPRLRPPSVGAGRPKRVAPARSPWPLRLPDHERASRSRPVHGPTALRREKPRRRRRARRRRSRHSRGPDLAQRWSYSSWRRHQTPVSLRPSGARSSHIHAPEAIQSARIRGIGVVDDAVVERERRRSSLCLRHGGVLRPGLSTPKRTNRARAMASRPGPTGDSPCRSRAPPRLSGETFGMPAQDEGACGPPARATVVRQFPWTRPKRGSISTSLCHRLGVAGSDGPVAVARRAEALASDRPRPPDPRSIALPTPAPQATKRTRPARAVMRKDPND
jgi:hypothetical protein